MYFNCSLCSRKEDPTTTTAAGAALTSATAVTNMTTVSHVSPVHTRTMSTGAAIPTEESRRKSALVPKNIIHIGHRYIVKPHPKRGFRKWAIKNKVSLLAVLVVLSGGLMVSL